MTYIRALVQFHQDQTKSQKTSTLKSIYLHYDPHPLYHGKTILRYMIIKPDLVFSIISRLPNMIPQPRMMLMSVNTRISVYHISISVVLKRIMQLRHDKYKESAIDELRLCCSNTAKARLAYKETCKALERSLSVHVQPVCREWATMGAQVYQALVALPSFWMKAHQHPLHDLVHPPFPSPHQDNRSNLQLPTTSSMTEAPAAASTECLTIEGCAFRRLFLLAIVRYNHNDTS